MINSTTHSIVFLCLLLISQPGMAVTYFVSEAGDDANSGMSWDHSWKTLGKAGSAVRAGDEIVIRRSSRPYRHMKITRSGTEYAPIRIRGEDPANPPVITGGVLESRWKRSAFDGVWHADTSARPILVVEDDTPLKEASNERCEDGNWHWKLNRLYYRPTDSNPGAHAVWRTADAGGILINQQSWIVIENIEFSIGAGAAINITSGHNNIIRNINAKLQWRGLNIQGTGHDNVLTDSLITQCREGVYIWRGAANNLITRNRITHNGNEPYWNSREGNDRSGIDIGHAGPPSTGNVISNNTVSHNGGPNSDAAIIAFNAPNTRIENNHVHNNYSSGINVTMNSNHTIVSNNIVESNGIPAVSANYKGIFGVSVRRSHSVQVLDNTLQGNHVSRDSRWRGKGLGPKGALDLQGLPGERMQDIQFINNHVSGTVGGPNIYISRDPSLRNLRVERNTLSDDLSSGTR